MRGEISALLRVASPARRELGNITARPIFPRQSEAKGAARRRDSSVACQFSSCFRQVGPQRRLLFSSLQLENRKRRVSRYKQFSENFPEKCLAGGSSRSPASRVKTFGLRSLHFIRVRQ